MRWMYCVLSLAALTALATTAPGEVVVREYAGYQDPNSSSNPDYRVTWWGDLPWIEILHPSDPNLGAYDFEAFDSDTLDPAIIDGITPDPNLAGDVELMVRGHSGRQYGALSINVLQFDPNSAAHLTVQELTIEGSLGSLGYDTYAGRITGAGVSAWGVLSALHVEHLDADLHFETLNYPLHIADPGENHGDIAVNGSSQIDIEIGGTLVGNISLTLNACGAIYGTIHVGGSLGSATIDVGQGFRGDLFVGGDLGTLTAALMPWATMEVLGDVSVLQGECHGKSVHIGGNLTTLVVSGGGLVAEPGYVGEFNVDRDVGSFDVDGGDVKRQAITIGGHVGRFNVVHGDVSSTTVTIGAGVDTFKLAEGSIDASDVQIAGEVGTFELTQGSLTGLTVVQFGHPVQTLRFGNGILAPAALWVTGSVGTFDVSGGDLRGALIQVSGDVDAVNVGEGDVTLGALHLLGNVNSFTVAQGSVISSTLDIAGEVGTFSVSGDLAPGNMHFGRAVDTLHVGGDVSGEGPPIAIDGDVTSGAWIGGSLARDVQIGGALGGTLSIGYGGPGQGGTLAGNLRVADDAMAVRMAGHIAPGGGIAVGGSTSSITVGGAIAPRTAGAAIEVVDLSGQVRVQGDVGGRIDIEGRIDDKDPNSAVYVGGTLDSEIRVFGALPDRPGSQPEIHVGAKTASSAITIDWDGYDPDDRWATGAVVQVGTQDFYGNDPNNKIYEVTCVKGDMTNDGAVTFADIDPFVAALGDGSEYNAQFPGLSGSRVFHADCNGDGLVTFADIDPFVALLGTSGCWESGGMNNALEMPADSGAPPASADPLAVAAMLGTYVESQHLPALHGLISELVAQEGDTPRGQFWAQVEAALP